MYQMFSVLWTVYNKDLCYGTLLDWSLVLFYVQGR